MVNKILFTGLAIGCLGFFPMAAIAQDTEPDELLALDIEELTVSVASKRAESPDEAPGVINVITAEDIKAYGARNLVDVLRRVPAMLPFGMYVLPNNVSAIRGPGSVIYGTNAFSGVINIKTKRSHSESADGGSASFTYGSFGTFTPRLGLISQWSGGWGSKLLYGEAFRAPYKDELSVNIPGVAVGDPMLKPETVQTIDAHDAIKIGVFNSYFSAPKPYEDINPGTLNVNPNEKSFNYLTANIDVDMAELFNVPDLEGVVFSLYGDNLLENDAVYTCVPSLA